MGRHLRIADVPDPAEVQPVDAGLVVTRVGPYRGDETRHAVIVETKRVAVLSAADGSIAAEGDAWTSDLASTVWQAAKDHAAVRHAVRLLNTRPYASAKLSQKLAISGHDRSSVARAVERCLKAGLLNDEALAKLRAGALAAAGRHGKRGMEVKLRQMGVPGSTARAAAAEAAAEQDETAMALELARKRMRVVSPSTEEQAAKRRIFGYLARRGFGFEDAKRAVDTAWDERAADDESGYAPA